MSGGQQWARLLARTYDVFPLQCPDCGADMHILAFLTEPEPGPDFDDVDPDGGA